MQDSHHQLDTYKTFVSKYWSILLIIFLTPILLCAVLPILPTHDDWCGTTTPDFNPFFIKERFLFYGYHWRPFDAIIGWIVGLNPQTLYPSFNHYVVVVGHTICTYFVFQLLSTLHFSITAKNITTIFFFITPATMATVSAIDSMNQVYALVFGIISFILYIKLNKGKYVAWISMVYIATWWKENGLMWALIVPILSYGFDFIDKKRLKKDIIIGLVVIIVYALAIFLLPKDITIHPEYEPGIIKMIKNSIKFLFTTFITVDYIYLLHQPSRNLLIAIITFLLALPFSYYIYIKDFKRFYNKRIFCIILCLIIAVAPHIGTVFSMMHTYAGLAFLAIIIAYSIDYHKEHTKPIVISFFLFCCSSLFINNHLIQSSINSGNLGKKMALEAIQKTGTPAKDVYVIIIEDDYPKISSFCVIPNEAFGWGIAAQYETNYQWPEIIQDTVIERSNDAIIRAKQLSTQVLSTQEYDCVWIINHQDIDVVKK